MSPLEPRRLWIDRPVAVVYGGLSRERCVSEWTGEAIHRALVARGYRAQLIDAGPDLPGRLVESRAAVVFNALHGTYGEDGRIQGLLDWMCIPYTGDGVRPSQLAMDKVLSKLLFRASGVPVAEDLVCDAARAASIDADALPFGLPAVVKPAAEGSSVGVTLARTPEQLVAGLRDAAALTDCLLIEHLIDGPEISVVTLGDRVLGSVEIEPARAFYDFEAKYTQSGTRYHVPPRLPAQTVAELEAVGLAAHKALGCHGVTRSDVLLGADGPVVLEVNTLPGMTATSLVPKVAAAAGIPFESLVELILDRAGCGVAGAGGGGDEGVA